MYFQRTKWDLSQEGLSGELSHTSVGSTTGIFRSGSAAAAWAVLSLEILLSPPRPQLCIPSLLLLYSNFQL